MVHVPPKTGAGEGAFRRQIVVDDPGRKDASRRARIDLSVETPGKPREAADELRTQFDADGGTGQGWLRDGSELDG